MQSLYQRYRPSSFDDVIGQSHVVKALKNAAESGTPSHAYVFAGGRGTGKTSIARIFARAVGADETDIIEMDAASHTSVDDVREIVESASVLPFRSPYKVYILDEAHMLSRSAFNALLKTLEEPPPFVIFILATTDPDKLPDTVLSRCAVFSFEKPGLASIRAALERAAKGEAVSVDADAVELVSVIADGSFRDGLSALEQVIRSHPGEAISRTHVETITGAPADTLIETMISAVHHRDPERVVATVRELESSGANPGLFMALLIERARLVLQARFGGKEGESMIAEHPEQVRRLIQSLAKDAASPVNSSFLADILGLASDIRRSPLPYALLEAKFISLSRASAS